MSSNIQTSRKLFQKAQQLLPGGVNSPVRAFRAVGGDPLFIQRAEGSRIWDADGNAYIDYVGSWGPLILGHRHPDVLKALHAALDRGTSFGAPSDLEIELAELVVNAVPSVEKVRMVNSGTEATMAAIRLARGITRRDKIVKFEGCYHGHADGLLVKAGSGGMTFGVPDSAGVPKSYAGLTLTLPYNDIDTFTRSLDPLGNQIACVILEPVAGNMGVIPPREGFLETIKDWTQRAGALLIFDEVITGFRVARGGAQERFGITPDLTCLGKILGGGLPVGAYGGPAKVMDQVAPLGNVYQAGTLSGNPLAMAAGIATLNNLTDPEIYEDLERKGQRLEEAFRNAAHESGVAVQLHRVGSMMGAFFTESPVWDYTSAQGCDTAKYARFFREMLRMGIYLAPSQFEAVFLSAAHGDEQLEATAKALREAMKTIAH
jgi:glutamate-1-semialdehyde 2,1-aminomutase